jgi:hypothetical protein
MVVLDQLALQVVQAPREQVQLALLDLLVQQALLDQLEPPGQQVLPEQLGQEPLDLPDQQGQRAVKETKVIPVQMEPQAHKDLREQQEQQGRQVQLESRVVQAPLALQGRLERLELMGVQAQRVLPEVQGQRELVEQPDLKVRLVLKAILAIMESLVVQVRLELLDRKVILVIKV